MSPKKKEHKKKKEEPPKHEEKKPEAKKEEKKSEPKPEPKKEEPKPTPKVVVVQKEEEVHSEPAPKVVVKKNVTAPVCPAPPKEKADAIADFPLPEEPNEDVVPDQKKPVVQEPTPVKVDEPSVESDPYLKKPTEESVRNKFDDFVRKT